MSVLPTLQTHYIILFSAQVVEAHVGVTTMHKYLAEHHLIE